MSAGEEPNRFDVEWENAAPDVLHDACCLSQQVLQRRLRELIDCYIAAKEVHGEANKRGMPFPDLLTAAEKAALEFVSQNPLQN